MELYSVRINGLENPLGYDLTTVICSWKVRGSSGAAQAYARIQVSLNPSMEPVLYVKEGADLRAFGETLELELRAYTRYYYRIAVTDDLGETAVSDIAWFETGKLAEPWVGRWIGADLPDPIHPEFQKEIVTSGPVAAARLYLCGLGLFEAYLNGSKVGGDLLAPFINDYEENVQYCSYDVTGLLQKENRLSVFLGNGWYRGRFGLGRTGDQDRDFALIAELRIVYQNGDVETVGTDDSWRYRGSCFVLTDIYDGETQDHLLWENRENPLRPASYVRAPAKLVERYSPPVHEMESLPVRQVLHTPAGETVLDLGQNFAGYLECRQEIPRGTTLVLEFGEILQNGNFYRENYRTAKSAFTYVSDGRPRIIRAHFTFFGFRYVRVSGLDHVEPDLFVGRAVYSQMDRTGFLHTGNQKINRLYANSLWGLRSNFLDMPTDCPQRDERLGWTGDAQVFAPTACFHMDTRAFYAKYLRDLRSDQLRNDGRVAVFLPNTHPDFRRIAASVWGDVATFLPRVLYNYFGSRELLQRHYPLMRDWVDYIDRADSARGRRYLFDFGFQYGDWLALDGKTEQSVFGRTDSAFLSSAYYYASTSYVAEAASLLGRPEAEEYWSRAENIRQAVLRQYFTETGRLAIDTQTAYLVALNFGIWRDKAVLLDGLRRRIENDCRRITGGFVGATMMNTVLAENGLESLAYDFLFYEGFPGWLYAVNLGATTIWERWNSVLPDGSISGTCMNSLNHYAYGSVVEFLYRDAAGLRPLEPAFRRVRIEPLPEIRLGRLECSYDSGSGRYVSNWEICRDGTLEFHIEIPFDCEAEVVLPEQEPKRLRAGVYHFKIRTERNYLAKFRPDTPLAELLKDPRAIEILDRYLPGLALDITHVEDPGLTMTDIAADRCRNYDEILSTSLAQVLRAPLERELRTDAYHAAIREICALC